MTEAQAEALAQKLPAGWLEKTRAKLAASGHHFSDGMISRVKNAHHQNADIEEALLEVAADEAARQAELTKRIESI